MNRQQRRAAERKGDRPPTGIQPPEDPAFIEAMQLHRAGRLAEAAMLCRQVIARQPRHADALHLIGVFSLQSGQPQIALDMIGRAIAVDGRSAQFHNNHGSALRALGRGDEAIASFRRAVAIKPDYVRAQVNLAHVLNATGQAAEAIQWLRRALALAPQDLDAVWALGSVLHGQGALDEAAGLYDHALRVAPRSPEILENLAKLRFAQNRVGDGVAAMLRLLELKPASPDQWCALAGVYESQTRLSEAIESYRQVIRYQPDHAMAFNAMAGDLADIGRQDESIPAYQQSVRLKPDYLAAHSNFIMTLHVMPGVSASDILAEARRYGAQVERRPVPEFANAPDPERRLRIGYVSADFRDHPVGFFLDRVLAAHDPRNVETILYSDTQFPDEQSERLRGSASQWKPILGMTDAEVAGLIRADGIDILIDLAGHTGNNRLAVFGARAAPVQASWLGYFGTTGVSSIDYVIADAVVLPVGEEALFTEQVVRLPSPYLCWAPMAPAIQIGPPPALAQGSITFGCFNNRRKINSQVIAVWAQVLLRVGGSRLLLKSWSLADPACREGLVTAFAAHGIGPERLLFENLTPKAEALAEYNRMDIALDPFPFGGCTTTADTLWMGVPLVTLAGDRWSGRMSRMILSCLGLEEWVAADTDAYVETAVRLAGDLPALAAHRAGLRARVEGSAFCDGARFTQNLEAAYRAMWRTWCGRRQS